MQASADAAAVEDGRGEEANACTSEAEDWEDEEERGGDGGSEPAAEVRPASAERSPPVAVASRAVPSQVGTLTHSFWIGPELPEWVLRCAASYLATGHEVWLWLYVHEERAADRPRLEELSQRYPRFHVRDAAEAVPYAVASQMHFWGTGPSGRWAGWAPFSDWFRCEVLFRYGGWWVDTDSLNVRSLEGLRDSIPSDALVFCTERHRMDRRITGAVAVASPYGRRSPERRRPGAEFYPYPAEGSKLTGFSAWASAMREGGRDACLVTNSHFFAPRGHKEIWRLGQQMRALLERYAADVRALGVPTVRAADSNGMLRGPLKCGNTGMQLFQRMARRMAEDRANIAVLHWTVFNPVDATKARRMWHILSGQEVLYGREVRSVHFFRQVRDEWARACLDVPQLAPKVSDEDPLPEPEPPRKERPQPRPVVIAFREVQAIPGQPLLKRRRTM